MAHPWLSLQPVERADDAAASFNVLLLRPLTWRSTPIPRMSRLQLRRTVSMDADVDTVRLHVPRGLH